MKNVFILRRIAKRGHGVSINKIIGDNYTQINREETYEEFCDAYSTFFHKDHVADLDEKSDDDSKRVYAFIIGNGFTQPLYDTQLNFVMMDNGQTVANLTRHGCISEAEKKNAERKEFIIGDVIKSVGHFYECKKTTPQRADFERIVKWDKDDISTTTVGGMSMHHSAIKRVLVFKRDQVQDIPASDQA